MFGGYLYVEKHLESKAVKAGDELSHHRSFSWIGCDFCHSELNKTIYSYSPTRRVFKI